MNKFNGFTALCLVALCALPFTAKANEGQSGKIYIDGNWQKPIANQSNVFLSDIPFFGQPKEAIDLRQIAIKFLNQNAQLLGASPSLWALKSTQNGELFQTARLERRWNGLSVIGGDAVVNTEKGSVSLASADRIELGHISASDARLSPEAAESIAFAAYQSRALSAKNDGLKILAPREESEARLVYEITVNDRDGLSSDVHYIDAIDGNELLVTTNVQTIRDRKVLSGVGNEEDFNLDESKWKTLYAEKGCSTAYAPSFRSLTNLAIPPSACGNSNAEVMASALAAWNNSGMVYDYFQSAHRRDSIDGRGMQLKSVVNFGEKFANAAWIKDKSIMIYGMGDGAELNDFALALDVAGHELTHGVTSSTSALEYVSESGALNESYSDVFGKLVAFKNGKANDWKLGKELFRDGKNSIRDMENPEVGHVKDMIHKGEKCSRMNDFCGVHTNSGVPNKAAVLIAQKLGLEKFGKLYYTVLTQMLRSSSNFKEARSQTEAACAKLFGGAKSADCSAVQSAFNAVGIQ